MQSAYLNTISKIMELPLASDQATFYIFIIFWIVLIYYYIAWKKTHPPLKRVFIESEAEPTPIYSPAAMRYIRRMRFDITVLIAAFLDLAVKGYVVLESKFLSSSSLTPKKNHSDASLSEEERDIFAIMQKSDNFFGLKPQRKVLQIKKALKKSLVAQYKNTYFIYHTPYLMIGILISLAIFPILFFLQTLSLDKTFFMLLAIVLSNFLAVFGVSTMINIANSFNKTVLFNTLKIESATLIFIIVLLITMPVLIIVTETKMSLYTLLLITGINYINFIFYYYLATPTKEGLIAQAKIQNFHQYLAKQTGTKNIETFEKYLPYAIALNLEKSWCQSMDEKYQPSWIIDKLSILKLIDRITFDLTPSGKNPLIHLKIKPPS